MSCRVVGMSCQLVSSFLRTVGEVGLIVDTGVVVLSLSLFLLVHIYIWAVYIHCQVKDTSIR